MVTYFLLIVRYYRIVSRRKLLVDEKSCRFDTTYPSGCYTHSTTFIPHQVLRTPKPNYKIVCPPCDTREMVEFPLSIRKRIILSVAQFR